MLVTDAMATVGSDKKSFNLYGTEIFAENGRLATSEGQLAGSDLNMMDAVRLTRDELGVEFGEAYAWRLCTLRPLWVWIIKSAKSQRATTRTLH